MTIAVAILVVALLSALILATFGIVAGGESKMRVTAINLAREGVEVVRNKRDTNWIDPSIIDWLEDFPPLPSDSAYPKFVSGTNIWTVRDDGYTFTPGDETTYPNFQVFKDANGLYVQHTGTPTSFYRALHLEKISDNELKVTCYVAFQEHTRWHLVNVEDHLFNWY